MTSNQIGPGHDAPIPDVAEPITGYRTWNWDDHGLHSYTSSRWKPGVKEATCERQSSGLALTTAAFYPSININDYGPKPVFEHTVPSHPDDTARHGPHGCGIYAYKTVEDLWRERHTQEHQSIVFGEVLLWGLVWPHEKGYRAQYAQPKRFFRLPGNTPTIWGDPIDALAKFYDVEVAEFPMGEVEREAVKAEARVQHLDLYANNYTRFAQAIAAGLTWNDVASTGLILPLTNSSSVPVRRRPWYRRG